MSLTALDIADNRYPLPLGGSGIFDLRKSHLDFHKSKCSAEDAQLAE